MSTMQKHHRERFDARTTSVDRILLVGMWIAVVAAIFVSFFAMAPKPYYSQIGDVDAVPRSGCQMICPGATLAGQCVVKKVVWRPPYPCVPSTY